MYVHKSYSPNSNVYNMSACTGSAPGGGTTSPISSKPALMVDGIPSAGSSSRAFLISRILDCGMGAHPLASLAMPACPGPPLGRRRRWGRPKGFPRLCKCAWSRPRTYLQLYFIINSMICPQVLKPHALFTSICMATTCTTTS